MDAGAVAGLFLVALTDATRAAISSAQLGFLGDALRVGVDGVAQAVEGPLADHVRALVYGDRARERFLAQGTWAHLAGLAWAEHLVEAEDGALRLAFDVDADVVRRELDAAWCFGLLTGWEARRLPIVAAQDVHGGLSSAFRAALVDFLAEAAAERLRREDLPDRRFLADLVDGLPARIARLFRLVPGADVVLARLAAEAAHAEAVAAREVAEITRDVTLATRTVAEATLGVAVEARAQVRQVGDEVARVRAILDGSAAADEAVGPMLRLATALVARRSADVFGRTTFADLPRLVHADVYVEPDATGAGVRGPAKARIHAAWQDAPLVILQAPFGRGKSLTCRDLAADLAAAWLADPARPYPLRLHCPDLLQGRVHSVRDAVLRHLEREGFSDAAAAWLWSKASLDLILDGFDELTHPEGELKTWLADLVSATGRPGRRILLATRPYGYDERWVRGAVALELEPLTDDQARDWLERHGVALGIAPPTFDAVVDRLDDPSARTPILLLMALWSWGPEDRGRLRSAGTRCPVGKAALYERFVEKISAGKWADVQAPHPRIDQARRELGDDDDGAARYREALCHVAWAHLVHTGGSDEAGLPIRALERRLERWRPLSAEQVDELVRALVLSLFFQKGGRGELRFTHRSFREYLCARYLLHQLASERREPERRALLLAIAEAEVAPGIADFLADLLDDADRAALLASLDLAIDRAEQVVIVGDGGARLATWGRDTQVVLTPSPPIPLLGRCAELARRIRGHRFHDPPVGALGRWLLLDRRRAQHRDTGQLALHLPASEAVDFGPYAPDGVEQVGDRVFAWLVGLGEPVLHARHLHALAEIGAYLARSGASWTGYEIAGDGRWLLGPRDGARVPSAQGWCKAAIENVAVDARPDPDLERALAVGAVLPVGGPAWDEILADWRAYVAQLARSRP